MYDDVSGSAWKVSDLFARNDDDFVDRLNHRITAILLVGCATLIFARQYGSEKSLYCWVPNHFSSSHDKYSRDICWVSNTHYVPFDNQLPREHEKQHQPYEIHYYQWVPFIILAQCLLCAAPILFWRGLNYRSGLDINTVVETAENIGSYKLDISKRKAEDKDATYLCTVVSLMSSYVKNVRITADHKHKGLFSKILSTIILIKGKENGNYIIMLYIATKLLFITSCVGQILLINRIFGISFSMYKTELLESWFYGLDTEDAPQFPKVTMCDFSVRRLGNLHGYTVQCLLHMNLLSEKIYMFIYFWVYLILVLNIYSLISWMEQFLRKQYRYNYVFNLLPADLIDEDQEREKLHDFVHNWLQQDGVFVLRLIHISTNPITVSEIVTDLWRRFLGEKPMIRKPELELKERHKKPAFKRAHSMAGRSKHLLSHLLSEKKDRHEEEKERSATVLDLEDE